MGLVEPLGVEIGPRRFDVSKLQGQSVNDKGEKTSRGVFQEQVCERVKELWGSEGSVQEKWTAVKSALCESAQSVLGTVKKKHPDWFQESSSVLKPLLQERNRLYTKWLGTKQESDRRKFAKARRDARRGVREAKNTWFLGKAAEAQKGRHGGKIVWRCIRDIQRGRRGLVPLRSATVRDEDGNLCSTPELQQQRWRRHFTKILNIQSQFDAEELESARQRPLRPHMADVPSREELEEAIGKLKNGKAGGSSGILPEMVKAASCEDEFLDVLLDLVCRYVHILHCS